MSTATASVREPSPDLAVEARRDLAAALRWAVRMNFHEGVCNHFSLALPGSADRYLINPHGLHFSEMTASDLLVVDGKGRVVEGTRPLEPTAFFVHSRIHRSRPSAKCVLHTHMPHATALTMIEGGRLEPCLQTSLRFHGVVAYDDDYRGLVLDEAEGDRIAAALGDCRVLFLANHGVIVVGPTLAEAFDDLYYLERACQAQLLAMSTGKPLRIVGDNLARAVQRQIAETSNFAALHFAALRRILDREAPDYRC